MTIGSDRAIEPAQSLARAGDRAALGRATLLVLSALLVLAMAASLLTGATGLPSAEFWAQLVLADADQMTREQRIIFTIRLPRMTLGMLVGAALAVSGLVMQGLFRNPLADPGLVGGRPAPRWGR